jgi:hypothetical protein
MADALRWALRLDVRRLMSPCGGDELLDQKMQQRRYIARTMCSLDDPEATRTWFLLDKALGTPVFDDRGVRLFTRQEIDAILQSEDGVSPGQDVA